MRYFQDVVENKLDTKEWPHQSECPAAWNGSGAVRWVFVSDQAGTGLLFWFLSNWRIYSLTTLQFCVVVSLSYAYTVSLCDLSLHIHFLSLRGLIEVNEVDFPVSAVRSSVCFFFLKALSVNISDAPPSSPQRTAEAQRQHSRWPPDWLTSHHLCYRRDQLLWDALRLRGHQDSEILRGHHW